LRGNGVKMEALERRLLFAAGDPDASFGGGNGLVVYDTFGGTNSIEAVVEDAQGRFYATGYGATAESAQVDGSLDPAGAMARLWLGRFNADGSLDTTFGDNGSIYFTGEDFAAIAHDIAMTADGKLLVHAHFHHPSGDGMLDVGVIRFNADGSVDTTFGDNGVVRTDVPGLAQPWTHDMTVGPDGSIVLAGAWEDHEGTGVTLINNLLLIRYTADGQLDANFGDGGILRDTFGHEWEWAQEVHVQADGKIIVGGGVGDPIGSGPNATSTTEFLVARYNPDGSRDTTFGDGGVVMTDIGDDPGGGTHRAMVVDSQGRITLAGHVTAEHSGGDSAGWGVALIRFTADGDIDATFGDGEDGLKHLADIDFLWDMTADADGNLLLSGSRPQDGENPDFGHPAMRDEILVGRYDSEGNLDESFGDGGYASIATLDEGTRDAVNGAWGRRVIMAQDGDIVVGGHLSAPGNSDGLLARFEGGAGDDGGGSDSEQPETPPPSPPPTSEEPPPPEEETPPPSGGNSDDPTVDDVRPTVPDGYDVAPSAALWSDDLLSTDVGDDDDAEDDGEEDDDLVNIFAGLA
jgi:uncharacterized delta-60 repeat protein